MKEVTGQKRIVSARVMEHALEFGRCGTGTRLLLTAFNRLLKDHKEIHQSSRLNSRMLRVIQSDPVNGRGERVLSAGDISLLEGYDFYSKNPLLKVFQSPIHTQIDRIGGLCTISIPSFDASDRIFYEGHYTHVVFIAAAAVLDFDRDNFVTDIVRSSYLAIKEPVEARLQVSIPAHSKLPVVLALGLEFYQVVNGQAYIMGQNKRLALRIVRTEGAR